jgi:DNA repair exonuclease SbcCD ATPase subunit
VIIFENISWRNFLSTGQQPTTINFNKNKTTLIIGSNGAGKSTLLDALCFSLYNKPFRKINRPQLINSINDRDVFVEVNFTIGKTKWKIERGIKPNIFKIYRDGKDLDQKASAIDQQKWLEQNVLKMDFRSFTQVVILGSSNFVPFMQLSAAHRREVIEDLLDIKIFSSMNTLIKEKIRQSKEEIKILDLKKESFLDKVKMQENFIEELENRGKENIQKKLHSISTLDKEVEVFMRESGILEENIFEKQKEVEEYVGAGDKLRKFGTLKGKISQKVSTLTKEHKFFTENTVCPTCTQEIDDTFRINRINDAQNKAKELQSGYTELEEAIKEEEGRERQFNTITKEILKLTNDISQNNIKISGYQRQIRDLESEVQTITKQLENRNTEHEKLESFKDNLKITYDSLASKKDTINYYDFSYSLLKDGGVKSKIIKKYLPLINQQVNRYLQMMDFYINFTLDQEFNETVQSPIHEDFSYSSFSEGEKCRINLALLFTWREVARLKNSVNCNLMILDEIFDSSLDSTGTEEFLKIIRYVIKDANIFVISHKTGLEDKFESVLRFEKVKGFSHMISP